MSIHRMIAVVSLVDARMKAYVLKSGRIAVIQGPPLSHVACRERIAFTSTKIDCD